MDYKVETDQGTYKVTLDKPPASQQELMDLVNEHLSSQPDLLSPQTRQAGGQAAAKEATKFSGQMLKNVVAPAAQAGIGLATGGLSLPVQSAIGAGVEYGLQKAGINPESTGQVVLQGAIPFAGHVVEAAKGLGRFGANLLGKGQQAGEQAIAKTLNVPIETTQRAFAPRPSTNLYEAARAGGPVDVAPALSAIQTAIQKEQALGSQANPASLKTLTGIQQDLQNAPGGLENANVMVDKAQRLASDTRQAFQRKAPSRGQTLSEATKEFKAATPGQLAADQAYTREDVVDNIFKAARKGKKVEAIDNYIQDNADKVRGVMSDKEINDVRQIASRMMNMGGDVGILKTGYDAALKSFIADPNGLTMFRHAFGPTGERLSPERLAGFMTFVRAYNAMNKQGNPQ